MADTSTVELLGQKDSLAAPALSKLPRHARSERVWLQLALLVGLCVLVRVPWAFIIPISEAPDEGAHYWVMSFIFNNMRLPGLADAVQVPNAAYYSALSTISYVPHLIMAALFRCFEPALAFRFGSVVMSAVAVVAAFFIGREVFPNSRLCTFAVPLFLVFHPQLVFVGAYSNNDTSSLAVSSFLLLVCVRMIKYGLSSRLAVALGVLSGLQAALKPTGYCLFPTIALSLVFAVLMHKQTRKEIFSFLIRAALLASVVAAPQFLKNIILFDGDLMGTKTMLRLWEKFYGRVETVYPWPVINHTNWRYLLHVSFWGSFGNMDRLLPGRFYKWCTWLSALVALGYVVGITFSARGWVKQPRLSRLDLTLFTVMASCLLFNLVGTVISSAFLNGAGPAQGRYLFPSEVAIAVLITGGLSLLAGRLRAIPITACLLLMAGGTIYGWCMLYPIYGFSLNVIR